MKKEVLIYASDTAMLDGEIVVEAGKKCLGYLEDDLLKMSIVGLEDRTIVLEGILGEGGKQLPYFTNPDANKFYRSRQLAPIEEIEIETWLPNPDNPHYLILDRRRTIGEVFADLKQAMKEQKIRDDLDYFSISTSSKEEAEPFPEFNWVSVFLVRGGNEGYYFHIEVIKGDNRRLLYLGKTLHEKVDEAIRIQNVLVRLFHS